MAMRYGYFDSEITGVDSEGMPIFDRAETSELFRLLFAKLLKRSFRLSLGLLNLLVGLHQKAVAFLLGFETRLF